MTLAAVKQTTVHTSKVTWRRSPRFQTIDELMSEVDRLADAERAGRLTCVGNRHAELHLSFLQPNAAEN